MSIKIGLMIYDARTSVGLTQKKLAEIAGVSEASINTWENGRQSPTADKLDKVLKACGYELTVKKRSK